MDRPEVEVVDEAVLTAIGRFKDESLGTRLVVAVASDCRPNCATGPSMCLVSRPAWSRQLLQAVASGQVDPKIISTEEVRHLLLHGDADMARQVAARWGAIRTTTPREKAGKIKAV